MTGRVIREALLDGPSPRDVEVRTEEVAVQAPGYRLTAQISTVGNHRYLDFTRVERSPPP